MLPRNVQIFISLIYYEPGYCQLMKQQNFTLRENLKSNGLLKHFLGANEDSLGMSEFIQAVEAIPEQLENPSSEPENQ
jgi:hypothetical protein